MSCRSTTNQADSTGAQRDPLTGLANHALLVGYAGQALARAIRHGWVTAVLGADDDTKRNGTAASLAIALAM